MEKNEKIRLKSEELEYSEEVRWNFKRLEDEKMILDNICNLLSELIKSREDEKKQLGSQEIDINQDLINQLTDIFKLFGAEYLPETIGGIKRATEHSFPWDQLKYLYISLQDPNIISLHEKELTVIIDVELLIIKDGLHQIINELRRAISIVKQLNELETAINFIVERINQAKEIKDEYENNSNSDQITSDKLDKILKKAIIYKNERAKDKKAEYVINFDVVTIAKSSKIRAIRDSKALQKKVEGIWYLSDLSGKNGFISIFDEYVEFYNDEIYLKEKKEHFEKIIKLLNSEIIKHQSFVDDIKAIYDNYKASASISNLESKIEVKNINTINQVEYNKIAMRAMLDILKLGDDFKPNNELHRVAMLDVIARVGELEKNCTFIVNTSKWKESRTILYHSADTKGAIEKFQATLRENEIFEKLVKIIISKYSLLVEYNRENFSYESGFLKESKDLFIFSENIDFLNEKLQKPQDYNISKAKMIELQHDNVEKCIIITEWIIALRSNINPNNENLQNYAEIFEQNRILELYACFMFKMIGEAFKFIEELELKESNNVTLKDFYQRTRDFFEKVRQLRGEMAHSPEFITTNILDIAIQLIEKEGLLILEELKNVYNAIELNINTNRKFNP